MDLWITVETLPFLAALLLLGGLALLEAASRWIARRLASALDAEEAPVGPWDDAPMRVLLALGAFAAAGYAVQAAAALLRGQYFGAGEAALIALPAGIAGWRLATPLMRRWRARRDGLSLRGEPDFVGRTGVICSGVARRGRVAEAWLKAPDGRAHRLPVEPEEEEAIFDEGTSVLLVGKVGTRYRCVRHRG